MAARDFSDPRFPNRDECVLRYLLDRHAADQPEKTHVVFEDGEEWSFADVRRRVLAKAVGLQQLGVRRGERGGLATQWPGGPADLLRDQLHRRSLRALQHGLSRQSARPR